MKANEINLNRFLSQPDTQFLIPVYQRNYDWTQSQCKQLLDDIFHIGQNQTTAHFIGSIVYVHDDIYSASGIRELSIIDGQQRLTTITLIYLRLYQLASDLGYERLKSQINETYLINKFAAEEEKLKLRPTENNDKALKFLLRNNASEEFNQFSRLIENFNYFKTRITEENYEVVREGLNKLMFVEISLDRDKDDPQKIFESLNSTGLELSQADLIRNFILMGLDRKNQNKIYEKYWEIIEQTAKEEKTNTNKVSDFIRDYLTLENKKIPNKKKVYEEYKQKFPFKSINQLETNLSRIKSLVFHYNKLLNPLNEIDNDIRKQLSYINRLEVNVAYPFIMKVYDDYAKGLISKEIFIEVLELIQSYSWRRFILGLPTNALNKIFMVLYQDVDQNNYLYSIQRSLMKKKGSGRFPRNAEVINVLKEKDMYNIKGRNRIYFLERLENYQNKEFVTIDGNTDITIEHIFPRNPDPKWKIDLEETEYNDLKEKYLHTIANLTLSGNNGALGNKPFPEKRDMNVENKEQGYSFSRLWLNQRLGTLEKWDKSELHTRFNRIKERFLKVWSIPDIDVDDAEMNEVNIYDAEDPTGKKLEYAIFFDQKLDVNNISSLYAHVVKTLFEIQPQSFFASDIGERINLTKYSSELRQALAINDTYFIENNYDSRSKVERIKHILTHLDLEDELTIKYRQT